METEKQELGHLVAAGIRFVKHDKKVPVYFRHANGLYPDIIDLLLKNGGDKNKGIYLPDGEYEIGMTQPENKLMIEKFHLGDGSQMSCLYLIKNDSEIMVGHSDSNVFARERGNGKWRIIELQERPPSIGNLVQDVIQESVGIPTMVIRGYDNRTKEPGNLRTLLGYRPRKLL